jgi:hypothetical protein
LTVEGFTTHEYEVLDTEGEVHTIRSRWMFNDSGTLVFRHGERGNSRIVAAFSTGHWVSVKLVTPKGDQSDQNSHSL